MIEVDLPLFMPEVSLRKSNGRDIHFASDSTTVSLDGKSARLSMTQFKLLRLLSCRGRVPVEEAQDEVWGPDVSDNAIRCTCSRLSTCLMEARIPYSVMYRRGYVILDGAVS
jgi:DNA-binding response OmpR family regulator